MIPGRFRLLFFLLISLPFVTRGQFYDGSNMQFGKNRVQFDQFEWQYYRFSNFETYFYTGGKDLAIYASKSARTHISEVEKFLDYYYTEKIKYIIYNKYHHYKQSNIGIVDEHSNLGGVNKVIGSKVFIYFEGDHRKFEADLKAGTVEVLMSNFLYGGDWRSVVRNSEIYEMPDWYFDGLISYMSVGWNKDINDVVKDGSLSGKYKRVGRLEGLQARYAGHSIWKYIAETYGEGVIPNILYVTKINKDVESGFLYVLGVPLKELIENWQEYLKDEYAKDELEIQMPTENVMKRRTRKKKTYYEFKLNPAGGTYAYATNQQGKSKIYLYDAEKKRRKKIFKHGIKLDRPPQYTYPILAWHPTGEILAFVYQKKGDVLLNFYDMESHKTTTRRIFLMEDILSISYSPDGKQMVFSGVYNGQSDIYLYNIPGNTQKKITDDRFDDLDPIFVNGSKEIMFSSNRNTLQAKPEIKEVDTSALTTDLYVYKIAKDNNELRRVTNTPDVNEADPFGYRNGDVYYLTDKRRAVNINRTHYDSVISSIDTTVHYRTFYTIEEVSNFKRNVLELTGTGEEGDAAILFYENGRYQMRKGSLVGDTLPPDSVPGEPVVGAIGERETGVEYQEMIPVYRKERGKQGEVDIRNYEFEDREARSLKMEKEVIVFDREEDPDEMDENYEFVLPQQRNYNLSFFKDQSVVQINNAFLNQQYQPFSPPYQSPGLGATILLGISDLFEDHKIYGGVRLATSSTEYMLSYQNLKRRLDKEYYVGLLNYSIQDQFYEYKVRSIRGVWSLKYPFTEVSSLHITPQIRRDKYIPQASDLTSLQFDIREEYWASLKLAYVYDNTRNKGVNIKFGTRYKFYGEYYQELNYDQIDMKVLGMDIRHYQRLHRRLILVTRLAASTSFGRGKLVYYLGGIDNWMASNKFNNQQPIDGVGQNYWFQANATNLRGFRQNIRNGNSMVLVNTELRWPFISYFMNKPMRSSFLENLQLIGFGDVGTAWTGSSPYSEDNDQIQEQVDNGPINIVIRKSNEPVVGGFGFGLRTTLLGYFFRLDWAWGVENGVVRDRKFYFSLSLDI